MQEVLLTPEMPAGSSFSRSGFSPKSDGADSVGVISSAGTSAEESAISSAVSEAVSVEDVSVLELQPNPIQPKNPRI